MKITHILKDGSKLDSIEGIIIKPEDCPEVYRVIKKLNKKRETENEAENEK